MSNVTPQQALGALKTYFSMGELEMLAFGLGISFEDLGGSGRAGKALAMLQYTQRHGKYDDLIQVIVDERDEVNWDIPKSTSESSAAKPQPESNVTYIVQGDMVRGDKVGQDKVAGDKTAVDTIENSSGVSVGSNSSAQVTNEPVASTQSTAETKPQPAPEIHIHGNVIGGVVGGGSVTADYIAGGDITIGSKEDFQSQLAVLEALIKEAIGNNEIPADDIDGVQDDVQDATKEAAKEKPSARRLKGRLEYLQEVLEKSAGVAKAAGKVGSAVLKAAPIAAGLFKAASILF